MISLFTPISTRAKRFHDTYVLVVDGDGTIAAIDIYGTGGCADIIATSDGFIMLDALHEGSTPTYGSISFERAGDDYDFVITTLTPAGAPIGAVSFGGNNYDFPRDLDVRDGVVAVTGNLEGPFVIGGTPRSFVSEAVALLLSQ